MVNRGPQLVQLMNGYRCRRSAGSASSRRQSAQVAVSAAIRVRRVPAVSMACVSLPCVSLATISKEAVPAGAMVVVVTRSILARGGASSAMARKNSRTAAGWPSTSANTPSTSLPTNPPSPRRVASAYTKGRKPTPWTMPSTRTAVLITVIAVVTEVTGALWGHALSLEVPPSRASPSSTSNSTVTSSRSFSAPKNPEYGAMPKSDCRTCAVPR
jgi:hypothetical protein